MKDPHHPQRPQAIAMLVLANLFWAVSFPVVKTLLLMHAQMLPITKPAFWAAAWTRAASTPRYSRYRTAGTQDGMPLARSAMSSRPVS